MRRPQNVLYAPKKPALPEKIIIIIIVIIIISCFVHWLISSQPLYLLMERVITHEKGPLDFDSLL